MGKTLVKFALSGVNGEVDILGEKLYSDPREAISDMDNLGYSPGYIEQVLNRGSNGALRFISRIGDENEYRMVSVLDRKQVKYAIEIVPKKEDSDVDGEKDITP